MDKSLNKSGGERQLRFALGQMACRLHDNAGNMAEACRLSREAARQGARLIVLPEGCLTGNALTGPERQDSMPADPAAFAALSRVAVDGGITICAGFIMPLGSRFNTVHAIIGPDGAVRFQHKAFRASTEPAFLVAWPDPERVTFTVDGVRIVIAICSELGAPGVRESMERVAPDVILHPSAGSMKPAQVRKDGEAPTAEVLAFDDECRNVVTRAAEAVRESGIPKLGTNPIGFDGETWWPGNSYAVDGAGRVVLWMKGENTPARMVSTMAVADLAL